MLPAKATAASGDAEAGDQVRIKMAGYNLDRVAGLVDGRVELKGCKS